LKIAAVSNALDYTFPYNLEYVDRTLILGNDLKELSGLSFDSVRNALLANNDEEGIIYRINKETGDILDKIHFGEKGDYEGIECVGESIYCIKSNGTIYKYNIRSNLTEEIKTPLKAYNDVEGLGFNGGQLLLACKGIGEIDKKSDTKKVKSIYFFDLKSEILNTDTPLNIADESLVNWVQNHVDSKMISKKDLKMFVQRVKNFSPSAIAKNPIDGMYYILSSVGKTLIVSDTVGTIKYIYFLNDTFYQPESLCFENDGKMYLGNEGKGFYAKIFVFHYKGNQ
jgi:uncharacterized protein YjiK